MRPQAIPFDPLVARIDQEPTQMRCRLDFADWLAANGHRARAEWIRLSCNVSEARCPLVVSRPNPGGTVGSLPWYFHTWTIQFPEHNRKIAFDRLWADCQPAYWQQIEGVRQQEYFGRFVFWILESPCTAYERLGKAAWLTTAFREGWLEALDLYLHDSDQAQAILDWPEPMRVLPTIITPPLRLQTRIDNRALHGLLELPGLQGLTLYSEQISLPCMRRFSERVRNLRYLNLMNLKRTGPSSRIVEQLPQLPELRVLLVGPKRPIDEQMPLLTSIPKLQCLYLYGEEITDDGLLALQASQALQAVVVSSKRITRDGIYALRKARPELQVILHAEARERLGPP